MACHREPEARTPPQRPGLPQPPSHWKQQTFPEHLLYASPLPDPVHAFFSPSNFRIIWWLMFSVSFPEEEIETRTGMGATQKEGWGQDSDPAFLCIPLGGPGLSALDMWCEYVCGHGRTCSRVTNRVCPALRVMPRLESCQWRS